MYSYVLLYVWRQSIYRWTRRIRSPTPRGTRTPMFRVDSGTVAVIPRVTTTMIIPVWGIYDLGKSVVVDAKPNCGARRIPSGRLKVGPTYGIPKFARRCNTHRPRSPVSTVIQISVSQHWGACTHCKRSLQSQQEIGHSEYCIQLFVGEIKKNFQFTGDGARDF